MENITKHASPGTAKLLIGNKIDMKGKKVRTPSLACSLLPHFHVNTPRADCTSSHAQIDSARGKALAEEYGMRFAESSAKDGHGVRDAFEACAKDVLHKMMAAGEGSAGGASASGGGASAKGDKSDKKDCAIM